MGMSAEASAGVTDSLNDWRGPQQDALQSLIPLVYDELRRLARRSLSKEHAGATLQTTALVHEAYLRLAQQDRTEWKNRAHFLGVAAQMIRRILVDHARAAQMDKRRIMVGAVSLESITPRAAKVGVDFMSLHEALDELESFDPQKARVVELRFFGGLSVKEAAEVLSISPTTVKREWSVARAWLARRLSGNTA
jgi:RNA polymerase sigma factor (TIGR02999 family)